MGVVCPPPLIWSLSSTKVTKIERKGDSVVATIEGSKGATRTLEAERMISAVGVAGNVEVTARKATVKAG